MARVTSIASNPPREMVFITDFTPPRSGDLAALDRLDGLRADFVSVAYNPGKLVRADSVSTALAIKGRLGLDVLCNLSPRDMNKIAIESRLLGARMLGLENVLVLQGDPLGAWEFANGVSGVSDYTATGLVAAVRRLNQGLDYREARLQGATDFCVGAGLDPSANLDREVRLTVKKEEAGAEFFVSQALYDLRRREAFLARYEAFAGRPLDLPVFWGVQVLARDGVVLGDVPQAIMSDLERGRSGVDIALEQIAWLREQGERCVYLISPILKGGARDYAAARQVLDTVLG